VLVGVQDGRPADVIHQSDVDFNEQEVFTTQVMSHDDLSCNIVTCEELLIAILTQVPVDWREISHFRSVHFCAFYLCV